MMSSYTINQPRPDVIRVAFPQGWDSEGESPVMFKEVLEALDDAQQQITLLIVAGDERPTYAGGLSFARAVLTHDRLKKMVVVAQNAQLAADHMSATRGERGLPPIPILAFEDESQAATNL
ncbi:MAG: hypothetical protein H6671_03825 [Anaerolineaceae bacterium]|nr:hypothetical protein [Anaerolineaceae bacterium]